MDHRAPPACALILIATLAACGSAAVSTPPAAVAPSVTVEPGSFRADVTRLRDDLEMLQDIADAHDGIRAVGTPGFEASVDAMAAELEAMGFEVTTPEVNFIGFRELPGATLEVGGDTFAAPDELHALIYSPGGEVTGPIAMLEESGCSPADFDGIPEGAVVVTTGGGCFRRDQAVNAADAGAAALVVGYRGRGPGQIYRPTLIDPSVITIPVVSVTDDAVSALEAAEGGEARLVVATEREPSTLRNVIAELGDGPRVLIIGAHLDSVLEGAGINDNGSGVAAVLEIARAMARDGVPEGWTVRIGLWGGEEFGDVGSWDYAGELGDEVGAYLNLDMAGSLKGANLVYAEAGAPEGSERITAAYESWFRARGEPFGEVDLGGSSDHYAFGQAGIPTGGLFAGAGPTGSAASPGAPTAGAPDACYHLACDDLDNVDLDRVALFAEATHDVALALMVGAGSD